MAGKVITIDYEEFLELERVNELVTKLRYGTTLLHEDDLMNSRVSGIIEIPKQDLLELLLVLKHASSSSITEIRFREGIL